MEGNTTTSNRQANMAGTRKLHESRYLQKRKKAEPPCKNGRGIHGGMGTQEKKKKKEKKKLPTRIYGMYLVCPFWELARVGCKMNVRRFDHAKS